MAELPTSKYRHYVSAFSFRAGDLWAKNLPELPVGFA
jgi:hypothetical protein